MSKYICSWCNKEKENKLGLCLHCCRFPSKRDLESGKTNEMNDGQKLATAWVNWNNTDKVQRFGQYLINQKVVPDYGPLWEEKDPDKAYGLAFQMLGL